jgi:hypothetical protein
VAKREATAEGAAGLRRTPPGAQHTATVPPFHPDLAPPPPFFPLRTCPPARTCQSVTCQSAVDSLSSWHAGKVNSSTKSFFEFMYQNQGWHFFPITGGQPIACSVDFNEHPREGIGDLMPVLLAPGHLLLPLVALPCLAAAAGGRPAFAFPGRGVPLRNPAAAAGTHGVHYTSYTYTKHSHIQGLACAGSFHTHTHIYTHTYTHVCVCLCVCVCVSMYTFVCVRARICVRTHTCI